ncbi:MAG: hypothetical protein OCD76_01675 [Reichenbachiella sp.]
MKKSITILSLLWLGLVSVYGQEYEIDPDEIFRSPFRKILNQFSATVTTGFNSTTYKHDLAGYYYLQSPNQQLITVNNGEALGADFNAFANWLNQPSLLPSDELEQLFDVPFRGIREPVLNPLLAQGLKVYDADSIGLGYKGRGWSIPLNMRLNYNYKDFRIGFGFNMEYHRINSLKPTVDGLGIRNYEPNFKSAFMMRYYGMLGYKFYDFWDYSFAGEIELGKTIMGKNFDQGLMDKGVFVNLGVSIEKNISEYFRVIVKPSYEFKNFNMGLPGAGSIKHKNNAFNLSVGVSITFPEIPRSPIKSDRVQLKHVIVDPDTGEYAEVRGQPFWKRQNPKVGENHRRLWKDRFRNRNKSNPY